MNDVCHIFNKDKSFQLVQDIGNEDFDNVPSSPLAVNTDELSTITVPSLTFHDFDVLPTKMKLNNNGRTVTLSGIWSADRRPTIVGSNLVEKYCFSHLHFHWTESNIVGSEHIVNDQGHALEMHLIFFRKSYKTIFEAELQQNGCVTLAYFFDISPNKHSGVEHISTQLNNVRKYHQTSNIPVFPLSQLVDNRPVEYFTYLGKMNKRGGKFGLSQWIVFTKAYGVTSEQVEQFRGTLNKRGHVIKRNSRAAGAPPVGAAVHLVKVESAATDSTAADSTTADSTTADSTAANSTVADSTAADSTAADSTAVVRRVSAGSSAGDADHPVTTAIGRTPFEMLRERFNAGENEAWARRGRSTCSLRDSTNRRQSNADAARAERSGVPLPETAGVPATSEDDEDGGRRPASRGQRIPLCAKITKTLLLRREFNQNKITSFRRRLSTTTPRKSVSDVASPPANANRSGTRNGSKPAWK